VEEARVPRENYWHVASLSIILTSRKYIFIWSSGTGQKKPDFCPPIMK
jgi:hypothetical protein